jgi:hypothetical protein
MRKFEKIYEKFNRIMLREEVKSFLNDEDDEEESTSLGRNQEPDESFEDQDSAPLPEPGEMGEGGDDEMGAEMPGDPQKGVATDEEVELAKFAVRAVNFNSKEARYNPAIYDRFEQGQNELSILAYIEKVMNQYQATGMNQRFNELANPEYTKGIVDKLIYLNQNKTGFGPELSDQKRRAWVGVIINAFKNGVPGSYTEEEVTKDNAKEIFLDLAKEFGHNTKGVISGSEFGINRQQ